MKAKDQALQELTKVRTALRFRESPIKKDADVRQFNHGSYIARERCSLDKDIQNQLINVYKIPACCLPYIEGTFNHYLKEQAKNKPAWATVRCELEKLTRSASQILKASKNAKYLQELQAGQVSLQKFDADVKEYIEITKQAKQHAARLSKRGGKANIPAYVLAAKIHRIFEHCTTRKTRRGIKAHTEKVLHVLFENNHIKINAEELVRATLGG